MRCFISWDGMAVEQSNQSLCLVRIIFNTGISCTYPDERESVTEILDI